MSRAESGRFFLYLVGIVVVLSGVLLAKGGLFLDRHEGDALHLIEIMLRMGQGQWPHLDFVTPLGIAAFLPMSAFVKAGFGIGMSVVLAQILVAAILIVWWFLAASYGPEYFATADAVLTSWFGDLVLFLSLWAVWYHFCAGIRHLIWDSGHGFELETAEKLGYAVIAGSLLLTIFTVIVI